jgi:hypothetical protein
MSNDKPATRCFHCLISIPLLLIIIGGIGYGVERNNENNLVETICLVIDAQAVLQTCGSKDKTTVSPYTVDSKNMTLTNSENLKKIAMCYLPVWTLEYNITTDAMDSSKKRARITGSYSKSYIKAMDELDKHPVSIINCTFLHLLYIHIIVLCSQINSKQTCYSDKRSNYNTVQWAKPNSKPALICLFVGAGLLGVIIIFTAAIVICSYIMSR